VLFLREVFDVSVESLTSADVENNSVSCAVCTKKGIERVPAMTYCTVCSKLFCRKDDEVIPSHNSLFNQLMTVYFIISQVFHMIVTITIHSLYCEILLWTNGRECRATFLLEFHNIVITITF